ncbi:GIN domain-containing protein [Hymenobacter saemangeumensis]|uniref:GIN domain-containing protein n=1 Tax=Hymenobacter saemangeumensis TaxID=1084522 RepID=UPI0031EA8B69
MPHNLKTLNLYNNVDLKLVQDNGYYVEVRAGEKVVDDIKLEVEGTTLNVRNTSTYNWTRSYDTPREVTLHLPGIRSLYQRGYGTLSSAGPFAQDSTYLHLIGAGNISLDLQGAYLNADMFELGDITLRGQIEEAALRVGGNGRLFADGLQTRRCYFRSTRDSNGDAFVRASDIFGGRLAGTGTTYYAGPPRVTDIEVSGRGKAVAR